MVGDLSRKVKQAKVNEKGKVDAERAFIGSTQTLSEGQETQQQQQQQQQQRKKKVLL